MKHVTVALNRHYPGRLHKFYVVDLPPMMRWPVKALVSLGHESTRQKSGLVHKQRFGERMNIAIAEQTI